MLQCERSLGITTCANQRTRITGNNSPSMKPVNSPVCLDLWIACIMSGGIALWPGRVILAIGKAKNPLS